MRVRNGALLLVVAAFLAPASVAAERPPDRPGDADRASALHADGASVVPDTVRTPRGALRRAAIAPGWGQIYNRQYLKLPFVYGGIAAFVVSAVRINGDYALYRDAYQYKAFQELVDSGRLAVNPSASGKDEYDRLADRFGPISSSPLRAKRDNLRRNRDLSVLGVGLVWALGVLDAYVSAHLLDFDVDENLSLQVAPVAVPGMAVRPGLRLQLGR